MNSPKTWLYHCDEFITDLASQLGVVDDDRRHTSVKPSLSIGMQGPAVSAVLDADWGPVDRARLIRGIVRKLQSNGTLTEGRPQSGAQEELGGLQYGIEFCNATKYILPLKVASLSNRVEHLVIWLSEPIVTPAFNPEEKWMAKGTFLFLIESPSMGKENYGGFMSGWSALKVLARSISEEHEYCSFDERDSLVSPAERLKEFNAVEIDKRSVLVLYKKRRIDDEIFFSDPDGNQLRSYGLIAYPIVICEHAASS